ncbi:MAG: MFS transporter [Pseudomonadota bacterium]|nr:MAG: MFS transporter [Pseudomonadota bacterium]
MFGLFLILPVFALYADGLAGSNAMLVGVALGAYGLTQALLQVPFGMLSDRFGRKPCSQPACCCSFWAVWSPQRRPHRRCHFRSGATGCGRDLGCGFGAAGRPYPRGAADQGHGSGGHEHRASFLAALILGPFLAESLGFQGLFWISGLLALAALPVIWWLVPSARVLADAPAQQPARGKLKTLLLDSQLIRLDVGIFVLHMVLTALFVAVPLALRDSVGLSPGRHWQVYVPVLLVSVLSMVPLLLLSMRRRNTMTVFRGSIGILLGALLLLAVGSDQVPLLVGGLWLFFTGFNLLEAMLPSLTSRLAPAGRKGSALGVYNTFQFSGVFFGGVLGGSAYSLWGGRGFSFSRPFAWFCGWCWR